MPYPWLQWRQPSQYFRFIIRGKVVNGGCVERARGIKRVIIGRLRHFFDFSAVNVESKVLINLESVNAITVSEAEEKGVKMGEALCLSHLSTVQSLGPRLVTQKFEN